MRVPVNTIYRRHLQTARQKQTSRHAFDTVPHQRLLMKLKHYGIDSNLHRWISSWLTERTQQVVIDGDYSTCKQVRSRVPQGTLLGPLMFLLYINDIGDHLNHSTIRLSACCIKLYQTKTMLTDYKTTWTKYKNGLTLDKWNLIQRNVTF